MSSSKRFMPGALAGAARLIFVCAATVMLSGCGEDMSDLEAYVAQIKARKPGGIEPLPEVKPYERFDYAARDLRNPFDASVLDNALAEVGDQRPGSSVSPNPDRTPEFLESFPLDSLRMVGTLAQEGQLWALIKTPDATIQRVSQGNHMGQNYGRIDDITDTSIELTEIVPDGFGGWRKREGDMAISE